MRITKNMIIEAAQQAGCLLEVYDGHFSIHIDRVSVVDFALALNEKLEQGDPYVDPLNAS